MSIVFRKVYFTVRDIYYEAILSRLIKTFLQCLGVTVGRNFYARALPSVVLDERSSISFGDNVVLKGAVEIRAINGAFVHFEDDVRLDVGVRVVATNAATVRFRLGSDIGCYSIFNCGDNFEIGSFSLVAGFCYFQTSDHKTMRGMNIKDQGYIHKSIRIGSDCWIGGGSFILGGANLENGVVVGANSVATTGFSEDSIIVGSPAKFVKQRSSK